MKPKPFSTSNHFTVPASSTDGPLDTAAWEPDRRGVAGTGVLLSTLRTSVTCGPLCPGPTRTSTVSPGCTALMPLPARTLPCRKASPDPSDSSTNPNPFSGLNHFTTARTGTGGCFESCSAKAGSGSESTGLWVVGVSVEVATPRMTENLISQL